MRGFAVAFGVGAGILLGAGTASAYCRTTTCDVDLAMDSCTWGADGCATSGHPLFWPGGCLWFGVQKDGSERRNISYDTFHATVVRAYAKWAAVSCGDGAMPTFAVQDTDALYGPIDCSEHEFNLRAANANAWIFRDNDWPYVGATTTLALTTLSVRLSNGEILDADTEINSFGANFTTSDTNIGVDLESVVTHESGHFLGLAHSSIASATMFAAYKPTSPRRSLDPDDEAGICAAYPPGDPPACGQPEPIYGFSKYCGGIDPSTSPISGSGGAGGRPSTPGSGGAGGARTTPGSGGAGGTETAPPSSGGVPLDGSVMPPVPTNSGDASVVTVRSSSNRSEGCSCRVGRRLVEVPIGAMVGALLSGAAMRRRRRVRRR